MLRFRADIEGLRAVAIVPILLFHAGVGALRGGYTGVDVFFVISGYLITQILMRDIGAGRYSLATFYQRRVARILPPLFVVLALVMALAPAVFVIPGDIADVQRSVAAAAGFVSNIFFWSQVDYFAHAAEAQPLLHTWSLGVEEQFYIFYPLLLWLCRGWPVPRIRWLLIAIAVVSLGSGIVVQRQYPASDFYLLPFRTWELVLGGLVALGAAPKLSPRLSGAAALGGLGLVAISAVALATWLPFPSPLALLPAGGTALIIAYGENGLVGRWLSVGILRWIGRISYSLYLWHWPIITFYRQQTGDALNPVETAGLVAASFVAGTLSYHLIERGTQNWLRRASPRRAVGLGLAGVGVIVGVALPLAAAAPRIWPIAPAATRVAAYQDYVDGMPHDEAWDATAACFVGSKSETLDGDTCLATAPGRRNVVLLGDSHANMYGPPLRRRFSEDQWLQATYFGCPPVLGGSHDARCSGMVADVVERLAASGRVQGIVLASRWRAEQAAPLEKTVRQLRARGLRVSVIGPVTEYEGSFPVLLARAIQRRDPDSVRRFLAPDRPAVDRAIRAAALAGGARYYSAYDVICPAGRCRLFAPGGVPMHFDYGHLTDPGAGLIVARMTAP